ncbi:hypothetical protein L1987_58794 [Smallanthus sonchifolius]|uniref:Uncharacterized protein n=1 Tax=Smallanthus sonchifolius TaxID=185202 RepID=A0ACB9D3F2_9ASTR|nr:hypothetical protein L1987_58794 [Smallanthus sonchifolius]
MGAIGRLMWMNTCSKKQCRSLFWRMRAAMKKAVKKHSILVALYGGPKKEFNFQYDPSSYALNFDDGNFHHHHVVEQQSTKLPLPKQQGSHSVNSTRVYVIWVGSF